MSSAGEDAAFASRAAAFAEAWYAAWNTRDVATLLEHYRDDVVFTSPFVVALAPGSGGTLHGKDALAAYFTTALERYPDLHFEPLSLFVGVASIVLRYRSVRGLTAAETMELDDDGRVARVLCHYDDPA